jgi:serine/threonine-protein kinase RsbW
MPRDEGSEAAEVHYRGPAVAAEVPGLRQRLAALARKVGLSPEAVGDLALACTEAMANVVDHAYGGRQGLLDVTATLPDHELVVTVSDHGEWQPPTAHRSAGRGRGLRLMRTLAHDIAIVRGAQGTTVRLHWHLPAR